VSRKGLRGHFRGEPSRCSKAAIPQYGDKKAPELEAGAARKVHPGHHVAEFSISGTVAVPPRMHVPTRFSEIAIRERGPRRDTLMFIRCVSQDSACKSANQIFGYSMAKGESRITLIDTEFGHGTFGTFMSNRSNIAI
jgi:hypothetical protein